jgi:hypothetical protein
VLQTASANKLSVNDLTIFNVRLNAVLKMEAVFSTETLCAHKTSSSGAQYRLNRPREEDLKNYVVNKRNLISYLLCTIPENSEKRHYIKAGRQLSCSSRSPRGSSARRESSFSYRKKLFL